MLTSRLSRILGAALLLLVLGGCDRQGEGVRGFVLPAGNVEAGRLAFVSLGCHQCHLVAGVDLPEFVGDNRYEITLGGKVLKVRSYGDLLTAVVNPDHSIERRHSHKLSDEERASGKSPMPDLSGQMSVTDLINIIEFLHSRYEERSPEYRGYQYVL